MKTRSTERRGVTDAQRAVAAAGLSMADLARAARVSEPTVRMYLRQKGRAYATASRLSRAIGCRIDLFLPRKGEKPA